METKPWVEGSLEVLELAIEQYYMSQSCETEKIRKRYLRLALINADDSAELSMKAFIQYHTNQKAPRNFPALVNFVKDKGPSYQVVLTKGLDKKLLFYHDQRSTLYHKGYILSVPRGNVFDYIFSVSNLLRVLFKKEVEMNIGYDLRRQYMFTFIELERILRDFCSENRASFDQFVGLQPILDLLGKKGVPLRKLEFNLGKVIDLQNRLTPRTIGIQEEQDIDEGLSILTETIGSLEKLLGTAKNSQ